MTSHPDLLALAKACPACGGRGKRPMLPPGMNAFKMRLPQMGKAMVDTYCFDCDGTGRTKPPANPPSLA